MSADSAYSGKNSVGLYYVSQGTDFEITVSAV
jgi:hypothetical protein